MLNIRSLVEDIATRKFSVVELMENCVSMAKASDGVFISIDETVLHKAKEIDDAMATGTRLPTLSGVPVSLKDLYDVEGQVTLAGSKVLQHTAHPAGQDSDTVAALRACGVLFPGRVNMSEFAFSGMGINPHYTVLKSIWDKKVGRIPGGSSSGSAVSVAEGIVPASMGSDTAGSCRIPAAFNGVVGVKPSYGRYSLKGIYPLSPSSDTPGPLAVDVDSCYLLDRAIMMQLNGKELPHIAQLNPTTIRLLVPQSKVLEELDEQVEMVFDQLLNKLTQAGVKIKYKVCPVLDECIDMFLTEAIVGYEAWQHHKEMIASYGNEYDPFVCRRLKSYQALTAEDQQRRYARKQKIIDEFDAFMTAYEDYAVIYPTVSCIAFKIEHASTVENSPSINLRCLRNTSTVNYFNGCSISLPCHSPGEAPIGAMISMGWGRDEMLYAIAQCIERIQQA